MCGCVSGCPCLFVWMGVFVCVCACAFDQQKRATILCVQAKLFCTRVTSSLHSARCSFSLIQDSLTEGAVGRDTAAKFIRNLDLCFRGCKTKLESFLFQEFEAFKKHSAGLLQKERDLNEKLRHLVL